MIRSPPVLVVSVFAKCSVRSQLTMASSFNTCVCERLQSHMFVGNVRIIEMLFYLAEVFFLVL